MNRSFALSLALHGLIILFCVGVMYLGQVPEEKELSFTVIEKFKVAEVKELPPVPKVPIPEVKKPAPVQKKKVYGLSRKSLTSEEGRVEVKAGNTIAKTPDNLELDKDDEDSIPIPTDEFLVSSMPRVLEEIRPVYPESARQEGIEGTVVLEIIIDQEGVVRQVVVVKSLGEEMDQAAVAAMKRFKFRPAKVNDESVAVKINYGIKFILEI